MFGAVILSCQRIFRLFQERKVTVLIALPQGFLIQFCVAFLLSWWPCAYAGAVTATCHTYQSTCRGLISLFFHNRILWFCSHICRDYGVLFVVVVWFNAIENVALVQVI